MVTALVALTLALAFANGANDVSKGIATLAGSGVSKTRAAIVWGTVWTIAGALTASFGQQALAATFSGKGLLRAPVTSPVFLLAVAIGAIGWLLVATFTGMPVSTTHALVGALCGAGIVSSRGVIWTAVIVKIGLPLALSPLISVTIVMAIYALMKRRPAATTLHAQASESGFATIDMLHWLVAGLTSFFRGLNDTPKIVALSVTTAGIYPLVACAMGLGGVIFGFRVTETLARRVTKIEPGEGFTANLVTSALVAAASRYALPVSTTHIATGSIVGGGLARGRELQWKTIRDVLLAWLVTLPAAALLGGAAYAALR